MEFYSKHHPLWADLLPEAHLLATIPVTIPGRHTVEVELWRIDPDSLEDGHGYVDVLQFMPDESLKHLSGEEWEAAEEEQPTWIIQPVGFRAMPLTAGSKALGIFMDLFAVPRFDQEERRRALSMYTDWSEWEVEEDGTTFSFEPLDSIEKGCAVCGGYAIWEVKGDHDPQAARIIECSHCILADATNPNAPGKYRKIK